MQLTEHFHANEFRCKCRAKKLDVDDIWCHGEVWVHHELVILLETLRQRLQKPITVLSGCRCPAYNRFVGGARMSQHKRGTAADISVKGVTPVEVALEAQKVGFRGIKVYPTFTHVDIREGNVWHVIPQRT